MAFEGRSYQNTCVPCKFTWDTMGNTQPCPLCGRARTILRKRVISRGNPIYERVA
jgi:rRNA maturation endonuclease Nob1